MIQAPYIYEITLKVRDYECDLQGIVNNANYQHYLEHARHEFLLSVGMSFSEFHDRGLDFVVTHVELDYKWPLRSKDEYKVMLYLRKEGIRWIFYQDIYHAETMKLCVKAKVVSVATVHGRPKDSKEVEDLFTQALPGVSLKG